MRVAVLGSLESWYVQDLRRAAADRHEIVPITFRQLRSAVETTGLLAASGPVDLGPFDAVLVRTMPPGSLEQVVFRMDVLGQLEAAGTLVVNPPRAIEAAVDKYLTTARLRAAGLPVPRTFACQTADDAMQALQALGGDAVLKPLFGSEGRGITRLQDTALAQRVFQLLEQLGAVMYLQEFVPHDGWDLRILCVGPRVFAMRRRNPLDWRTNISRGARGEPAEIDDALADMARRAAAAVSARWAGVDLLQHRDGRWLVVEVNAVPGWRSLAAVRQVDIARSMLDDVQALRDSQ